MSLLAPFFVNTYPINQNTESALLFEDADVKTIADTYTKMSILVTVNPKTSVDHALAC